jgi:hypothetical protein
LSTVIVSTPKWKTALESVTVVSSTCSVTEKHPVQRCGRARDTASGAAHQRPLKRHDVLIVLAVFTSAGRGHIISIAAVIAAASSAVGAG